MHATSHTQDRCAILKMSEKEKIKYLDLIIKNIENFEAFSVKNIIYDYLKPNSQSEKESFFKIVEEIKLFGKNNDLFVSISTESWCKLTEKGKRLKLSGKSFKNFKKSDSNSEWYNKNWVGFSIAFLALLFNIYQNSQNVTLKREYNQINTKYDSLKTINKSLYDSISMLKKVNLTLKDSL